MNSSTSERIISEGRLSTQKYPSSSKAAIAVDFPAPENPVMITRSVRAGPSSVEGVCSSSSTRDASMLESFTGQADERAQSCVDVAVWHDEAVRWRGAQTTILAALT